MAVLNAPSHPQVLFVGFTEDDPGYQAMASLVPSARIIPAGEIDTSVRAAEWDVLVTNGVNVYPPDHMHLLVFGSHFVSLAATPKSWQQVYYDGTQVSAILHVNDDLGDHLRRLVATDLVPLLEEASVRRFLTATSGISSSAMPFKPVDVVPFVSDDDGHVIAGDFLRGDAYPARCWALPLMPRHPERWLAAALADWHEKTPDRVPLLPGWRTRPTWLTAEETAAQRTLAEHESRRAAVLADLDAEGTRLMEEAETLTQRASAGERRLLTEQGEPLVAAVHAALVALGFEVEDADKALTPGEPKGEDLRVRDPDEPTWTNITEVKGYARGAKSSDLQVIARHANLYERRTGAAPTSRWYVVNHHLNDDPDTRPQPLAGTPDDVAVFAEDGGLVIDTRDLFRLLRAVTDGTVAPGDARAALRQSRGVFVPGI